MPEELLWRRPQNFDVRLSVTPSVYVSLRFDYVLDPDMCDIALNNPTDGKKKVPLDPVRKHILMWKKSVPKSEQSY